VRAVSIIGREDVPHRLARAAEHRRHREVAVDRVLLGGANVHPVRVEERGHLTRSREPDTHRCPRSPSHPAAAEQALQIDDQVVLRVAQAPAKGEEFVSRRPVPPRSAEALAVEEDQFIQLRVPLENARAGGRHQPVDPRGGKPRPQQVQDRQRMHHVAHGTGLDDQDALRRTGECD
jgi:hypothetical protein